MGRMRGKEGMGQEGEDILRMGGKEGMGQEVEDILRMGGKEGMGQEVEDRGREGSKVGKGKGGKEENVRVNKDISARVSLYTKTHLTAMRTENLGLGGLQSEGVGAQ